jgi:hypothetical protein
MIDFDFPRLGATGEGEPVYPPGTTRDDFRHGETPLYWQPAQRCSVCSVPRENVHPGGQWYSTCPFSPNGGDHQWSPKWGYYVTYQLDRPACAFRCHYPGGSSPCDQATADRFIEWVTEHESEEVA